MLTGRYWPCHPKPRPDEVLSSWILRTAFGNGLRPSTFCQLAFGNPRLLATDIDRSGGGSVLSTMAARTATPPAAAASTALASMEGVLVESWFAAGRTRWVLNSGTRHRLRRVAGMQYCPRCLEADDAPYFRRAWRLALFAACPTHGVVLLDRCPDCRKPLMAERADELARCGACHADLRRAEAAPADFGATVLHRRNQTVLARGWATLGEYEFQRSHLYFDLLYQVLRLLFTGRRADRLRAVAARRWGGDDPGAPFPRGRELEALGPAERHRLFSLAARLLEGWPYRFVGACGEAGVTEAYATVDVDPLPFAFADPVRRHLCAAAYVPSIGEVQAAARYLRNRGVAPSGRRLRLLVGDTVLIRSVVPTGRRLPVSSP
ncbi:MAG TPA: TniQ family protein [Azospirillaceae bacterium]|nr:TniQ family protein [Azospirillaceae bacterium]